MYWGSLQNSPGLSYLIIRTSLQIFTDKETEVYKLPENKM